MLCAGSAATLSALAGGLAGCAAATSPPPAVSAEPSKAQLTVLYDAFGKASAMQKDWGYAAVVDYGGKRILFDTGNNPDILAQNAKAKNVDLSRLDFVVMSHRHGDHMGGIPYLPERKPQGQNLRSQGGVRRLWRRLAQHLYRKDTSLPAEQRYYDGAPPEVMRFGSAWPGAAFQLIGQDHRDRPWCPSDLHWSPTSRDPGTPRTLARDQFTRRDGDHRGLLASRHRQDRGDGHRDRNPRIHFVVGGFHLVASNVIHREGSSRPSHDRFAVAYVAPGHCTGEPTFTALRKAFADRYLYAGLNDLRAGRHAALDGLNRLE